MAGNALRVLIPAYESSTQRVAVDIKSLDMLPAQIQAVNTEDELRIDNNTQSTIQAIYMYKDGTTLKAEHSLITAGSFFLKEPANDVMYLLLTVYS